MNVHHQFHSVLAKIKMKSQPEANHRSQAQTAGYMATLRTWNLQIEGKETRQLNAMHDTRGNRG